MKKLVVFACLVFLGSSLPVHAQGGPSSWGVVGSFVPQWRVTSNLELLASAHFSEDDLSIADQNLKGGEFRLGIARGRSLSGDWGVSFVRRTYDDATNTGRQGGGCQGGGSGAVVLKCDDFTAEIVRRDVRLNGLEVDKFIPFVTISQRVQVGMTVGGGFGYMSGQVDTTSFRTDYTCTFPPGVFPDFDPFDDTPFGRCQGATISNVTTVVTDSSSEDVTRILKSDSTLMPLGKVEVAVGAILTPQFKVRVSGGLNYPGVHNVSITGVYFFSAN